MNRSINRLLLVAGFGVAVGLVASSASAGEYDLYTSSSTATINGAIFKIDTSHPTGTGFIDSFLRIQQKGTEQGYNTPLRPVQFDEKTDPNFTRNLTYSEAAVVNLNGTAYRAFLLDINENVPGGKLTLEQLEIYISPNALTQNNYSSVGGGSLTGATKIYDMDNGTNNWVNLDYNLNSGGSGTGDMIVYIPNSLFAAGNNYITLYSQFGCKPQNVNQPTVCKYANKYASQAGFEEWWALTDVGPTTHSAVPEPGSLLLLGTGALAFVRRRARRAK